MSQTLYLECYSGISGDMTVAALLDLGADQQLLKKALKSLPITGFETVISRVKRAGLDVCDFQVILDQDNHDHDMTYLHDHHHHPHSDDHGHSHNVSEPTHHHDHQEKKSHSHANRGLSEIVDIINQAQITDHAKELITPTGAAIVAAIKTSDQLPKQFTIEKTGIGAGKRTYDRPSLLRAMLITDKTKKHDERKH